MIASAVSRRPILVSSARMRKSHARASSETPEFFEYRVWPIPAIAASLFSVVGMVSLLAPMPT